MSIDTNYYNYYNIKGSYTTEKPEVPGWKEKYAVTTDKITKNNYSQDSDAYRAYCKLEDTYYKLSVSNREKYGTERELTSALAIKYSAQSGYSQYSDTERSAMYHNELNMTLYGCLNGGGNVDDPHIDGDVCDPTDSEKQSYNRQMVNEQLKALLSNSGIDISLLTKYKITYTIDPVNFILQVSGVDDEELASEIEGALNTGKNAKQLFCHILNSSQSSISEDVLTKYRTMKDFQNVTGLDLSEFTQTVDGFVNADGENALDVYKEYLGTSDAVPSQFKGAAYSYFESLLDKLSSKTYAEIPDLILSIGYQNNALYDISDSDIQTAKFDVSA